MISKVWEPVVVLRMLRAFVQQRARNRKSALDVERVGAIEKIVINGLQNITIQLREHLVLQWRHTIRKL